MNADPQMPVWVVVSNGDNWEFGSLKGHVFTDNQHFYTIQQLDELYSALVYLFDTCSQQAQRLG